MNKSKLNHSQETATTVTMENTESPKNLTAEQEVTALQPIQWREPIVFSLLTLGAIVMTFKSSGQATFSFKNATSWFEIPDWTFSAFLICAISLLLVAVACAFTWWFAVNRMKQPGWAMALVLLGFILCFLSWTMGGNPNTLPVVVLLSGGLGFSVPLILGSMSGILCERTGVINIAIEGQLLAGAFLGVVVANAAGSVWLGLIGAPIAGILVSVLLALFTVNLRTDHIIVGVVLNMLVLGLTNFLYSTLFVQNQALNTAVALPKWRIPVLADIPVIGPVLFDQNILIYLMYLIVLAMNIGFFKTKWGLRSRACGEHPKAADTVGIKVNQMRWLNVLLGGAVAGLGGAFLTLGGGLSFIQNMSAGNGFIALAAMILGDWNPIGALTAALLFGFTTQLGSLMMTLGSPIPSEYLLMIPYLITVFAVAGFVGKVRPPAMEGKPYPL